MSLLAEGIKDGKVVAVQKKMPSRRSTKLRLYADDMGRKLNADGSDFIVVVAEVTDDNGNVKRLAKDNIYFTVEGEGRIIGDGENIMANPRIVEWGTAPVLIQATDKPGKITIKARSYYDGVYAPAAAELTIESVAPHSAGMLYRQAHGNRKQARAHNRRDKADNDRRGASAHSRRGEQAAG